MERFVAHGRNPYAGAPVRVATWPSGSDWPPPDKKTFHKKAFHKKGLPHDPRALPPA
jgi:hypothetical protein